MDSLEVQQMKAQAREEKARKQVGLSRRHSTLNTQQPLWPALYSHLVTRVQMQSKVVTTAATHLAEC